MTRETKLLFLEFLGYVEENENWVSHPTKETLLIRTVDFETDWSWLIEVVTEANKICIKNLDKRYQDFREDIIKSLATLTPKNIIKVLNNFILFYNKKTSEINGKTIEEITVDELAKVVQKTIKEYSEFTTEEVMAEVTPQVETLDGLQHLIKGFKEDFVEVTVYNNLDMSIHAYELKYEQLSKENLLLILELATN